MNKQRSGFTLVELLIVIVVIAILASISIVAYQGIQSRARDTQRLQDVKTIAKAMEMYYADKGVYPPTNGSTKINTAWVTTADASWANLEAALVPAYISSMPKDPQASQTTNPGIWGGYNYDMLRLTTQCSDAGQPMQKYMITYRLESQPQKRDILGTCTTSPPTDYSTSEYIVVK